MENIMISKIKQLQEISSKYKFNLRGNYSTYAKISECDSFFESIHNNEWKSLAYSLPFFLLFIMCLFYSMQLLFDIIPHFF